MDYSLRRVIHGIHCWRPERRRQRLPEQAFPPGGPFPVSPPQGQLQVDQWNPQRGRTKGSFTFPWTRTGLLVQKAKSFFPERGSELHPIRKYGPGGKSISKLPSCLIADLKTGPPASALMRTTSPDDRLFSRYRVFPDNLKVPAPTSGVVAQPEMKTSISNGNSDDSLCRFIAVNSIVKYHVFSRPFPSVTSDFALRASTDRQDAKAAKECTLAGFNPNCIRRSWRLGARLPLNLSCVLRSAFSSQQSVAGKSKGCHCNQ